MLMQRPRRSAISVFTVVIVSTAALESWHSWYNKLLGQELACTTTPLRRARPCSLQLRTCAECPSSYSLRYRSLRTLAAQAQTARTGRCIILTRGGSALTGSACSLTIPALSVVNCGARRVAEQRTRRSADDRSERQRGKCYGCSRTETL